MTEPTKETGNEGTVEVFQDYVAGDISKAERIARAVEANEAAKIIKIFVRLDTDLSNYSREADDDRRRISFRIPDGIDPIELLDQDFAVDGNEAVATVAPYWPDNMNAGFAPPYKGPFACEGTTMPAVLAESQQELVKFFRERGFEPQFA